MTPLQILWFCSGMLLGAAHAWMLWKSTRSVGRHSGWLLPRLMLAGGVLFFAAVQGAILPAAAGWCLAWFSAVGWVAMGVRT